MRHRKHNHQLGVKSAHRVSLVANLSCSLIEHGRIKTTLAKARALRPSIEKIVTLAKKAHATDDSARKVHYRRLAIARLRNKKAVSKLFDEMVDQFTARNGGYTRIYKLALPRLGDAADMALIEFVEEAPKKSKKKKSTSKKKESVSIAEDKRDDGSKTEGPAVTKPEKKEVEASEDSLTSSDAPKEKKPANSKKKDAPSNSKAKTEELDSTEKEKPTNAEEASPEPSSADNKKKD